MKESGFDSEQWKRLLAIGSGAHPASNSIDTTFFLSEAKATGPTELPILLYFSILLHSDKRTTGNKHNNRRSTCLAHGWQHHIGEKLA
jgi:hypothetical protein